MKPMLKSYSAPDIRFQEVMISTLLLQSDTDIDVEGLDDGSF